MKYLKSIFENFSHDLGDVKNILLSVLDLGFTYKSYLFWANSEYKTFQGKTEYNDMGRQTSPKYDGKRSLSEISGYSKCYNIKLSKSEAQIQELPEYIEELQTCFDRLGEIGKVYPKIFVKTNNESGTIHISSEIEIITSNKIEMSERDKVFNLLKKNKYDVRPLPNIDNMIEVHLQSPFYGSGAYYKKDLRKDGKYWRQEPLSDIEKSVILKERRKKAIQISTTIKNLLKDYKFKYEFTNPSGYKNDFSALEITIPQTKIKI